MCVCVCVLLGDNTLLNGLVKELWVCLFVSLCQTIFSSPVIGCEQFFFYTNLEYSFSEVYR